MLYWTGFLLQSFYQLGFRCVELFDRACFSMLHSLIGQMILYRGVRSGRYIMSVQEASAGKLRNQKLTFEFLTNIDES